MKAEGQERDRRTLWASAARSWSRYGLAGLPQSAGLMKSPATFLRRCGCAAAAPGSLEGLAWAQGLSSCLYVTFSETTLLKQLQGFNVPFYSNSSIRKRWKMSEYQATYFAKEVW